MQSIIIHNEPVAQTGASLEDAQKVLVMIHGRGDTARGFINLSQRLHISTIKYAIVAPQAIGNTWYPHGFMEPVRRNEPQLSLSLAAIGELLDVLNGFNLEPADVYFLGFSQGACLLLEYCARHARKYGGIIAFTGGSIGQEPDLSQYEGSFEGTPVFIGASNNDPNVPESRINQTEVILSRMGAKVIKKIYSGLGRTVHADEWMLADLVLDEKLCMKTAAKEISLEAKREIVTQFIRRKDAEIRCLRRLQGQRSDATSQQYSSSLTEPAGLHGQYQKERPVTALDQAVADRDALDEIDCKTAHDTVSPGALIRTNVGYILVSTALREIRLKDKKVMGISPQSALFEKMQGLKAPAEFHLGDTEYVIFQII